MDLADILRRIENLIRYGIVAEVDYTSTPAKCRVKSGNITTDFLPFINGRAGTTIDWDPVTVGEQCIIFSPSGELSTGTVIAGLNQESIKAPSASKDEYVRKFPDRAIVKYNHASSHLEVTGIKTAMVKASVSVTVDTPDATFTGNVTINGNATVDKLLTYKGGMNGSATSGASAKISGPVEFTGSSISHNGKEIGAQHKHSDPQGGNTGGVV